MCLSDLLFYHKKPHLRTTNLIPCLLAVLLPYKSHKSLAAIQYKIGNQCNMALTCGSTGICNGFSVKKCSICKMVL